MEMKKINSGRLRAVGYDARIKALSTLDNGQQLFFHRSLHAFGGADFEAIFKQEMAQLGADHLPLQQGLTSSNYVADSPITVMVNNVAELKNVLRIKVGIFYQGIISGCSCADDPTPISENNEYCELQVDINMITAATSVNANDAAAQQE